MSLSFVSKSVQTARDDGGYDEKPIENGLEISGTMTTTYQKPLFEQLRDRQEREELEREEEKVRMMRSTLALDEEDAAHLQLIHEQQIQSAYEKQIQTQSEINEFRAAQAKIRQKILLNNDNDDNDNDDEKTSSKEYNNTVERQNINDDDKITITKTITKTRKNDSTRETIVPKIIAKKRRTIDPTSVNESTCTTTTAESSSLLPPHGAEMSETIIPKVPVPSGAVIRSLLSGYGSSSSSSSDDET
jgi:FAM192A/Fyv6, N-terminal domain